MAAALDAPQPLFDGRWFDDEVIIWFLRWYFRYKLSYRDLVAMMRADWQLHTRRFFGGRSVTPRNLRSGGVATNAP